jgi:hypothetical protein
MSVLSKRSYSFQKILCCNDSAVTVTFWNKYCVENHRELLFSGTLLTHNRSYRNICHNHTTKKMQGKLDLCRRKVDDITISPLVALYSEPWHGVFSTNRGSVMSLLPGACFKMCEREPLCTENIQLSWTNRCRNRQDSWWRWRVIQARRDSTAEGNMNVQLQTASS